MSSIMVIKVKKASVISIDDTLRNAITFCSLSIYVRICSSSAVLQCLRRFVRRCFLSADFLSSADSVRRFLCQQICVLSADSVSRFDFCHQKLGWVSGSEGSWTPSFTSIWLKFTPTRVHVGTVLRTVVHVVG